MNYPVTDRYLADTLDSAAQALKVMRPGLADTLYELALLFDLRDNCARLTMRDFETVCEYVAELSKRAEHARRWRDGGARG